MKYVALALVAVLAGCSSTPKPATDLSGAGFILETPNSWSRANVPMNDRLWAEQVAVNRAACLKAPLCRK